MAKVKPRVKNIMDNTTNTINGNDINSSTTNCTINWPWTQSYYSVPYCEHRLPCGYCKLLNKDCPQKTYSVTYCTSSNSTPIYTDKGPTCTSTNTTIKYNN